jgi:hypothetical protein
VLHFNVTANPTAAWTAQQLVEAFPWQDPPKYLLCDRDRIYGPAFGRRVAGMGFEEVVTAARSPWQNPFAEPLCERNLRAVVRLNSHRSRKRSQD